jgi:hypothetical protein
MVKKIFFSTILVLVATVIFAPKKSLYYFLESKLESSGIILSNEILDPNPLGLTVKEGNLYMEGTHIADIESISIVTLLLYNGMTVSNLNPTDDIKKIVPMSISEIDFKYVVWNPLKISIKISGDVGDVDGEVDLIEKRLTLRFKNGIRNAPSLLRRKLRKDENGWYYEKAL